MQRTATSRARGTHRGVRFVLLEFNAAYSDMDPFEGRIDAHRADYVSQKKPVTRVIRVLSRHVIAAK